MRKSTVHVLVVDDFAPWIAQLRSMLQMRRGAQVLCAVSNGLEAIEKAQELQPDLILLDIGLPKLNGIAAARKIHEIAPHSKILFLSEYRDPEIVQEALSAGSRGYVLKSHAGSDLMPALEAVLAGGIFVTKILVANDASDARQVKGQKD